MTEQLRYTGIAGTGSAVPERILTNAELEKMVETSDEWITSRTGIKQRRIADATTATSDLAVVAARRAIEDSGLDVGDIGGVVVATVTPDMPFPSTACIVQNALGLPAGLAFDISAGCSGFVYALSVVHGLVAIGSVDNVLVIGADVLSRVTDWNDRSTCVLFGDGAGAVIVKATEEKGILSTYIGADGTGYESLMLPGGGSRYGVSADTIEQRLHFIKMSGNEVYKFAVRVMSSASEKVLELAGVDKSRVDLFIPHQANVRIIEAAASRLGLPHDRVFVNVDKYGNTSAASIPIALDEAYRQGLIKTGDNIVMVGFGAGLTWGAALVRWIN